MSLRPSSSLLSIRRISSFTLSTIACILALTTTTSSTFLVTAQATPAAAAAAATVATSTSSEYPLPSKIPSVDHPQVQQWLKEINLADAPKLQPNVGEPPECPALPLPEGTCYWTCEDCSADDVVHCPDKNVWGLTFDDGPTPATPDLLKFLDEQKVKATFFLVGGNVIQYPELVKAEAAAGHHLASHTWSHHALTTLTNEQIVAEIKWTEKAIFDATGLKVRYMRPPYGDVDNRVRYVLKQLGYTIVDWTGDLFDSDDWQIGVDSSVTLESAKSKFQTALDGYTTNLAIETKGFISLEHDLSVDTVAVAKSAIPFGLARNLTITTVASCLGDTAPYAAGSSSTQGVPPVGVAPGPQSVGVPTTVSSTSGDGSRRANSASSPSRSSSPLYAMATAFLGSMMVAL
ncbi:chitin deacetylase, partial [Podila epigama]